MKGGKKLSIRGKLISPGAESGAVKHKKRRISAETLKGQCLQGFPAIRQIGQKNFARETSVNTGVSEKSQKKPCICELSLLHRSPKTINPTVSSI